MPRQFRRSNCWRDEARRIAANNATAMFFPHFVGKWLVRESLIGRPFF
jgi:hypothetical protein